MKELKEKKEASEKEVVEEITEVEVDEKTVKAVADKIKAEIGDIKEKVEVKSLGEVEAKIEAEEEISKEMKLVEHLKTLQTTTTYDDLIPPTEFVAEIQKLEEQFGVALRDAYIHRTTKTSVTLPKKTADLIVYDTAEGAKKTASTPTYDQVIITLKKYAAVAPLTDELDEDSAVNIWNELTESFARAFAKKADEIVFTDTSVGILRITGTNVVTMAAARGFGGVTFDNLSDMIDGVPSESQRNGKFYLHRTLLGVLRKVKDTTGQYIWQPGPNGGVTGTIWGYPYELVEVMPTISNNAPSTSFMIFGDLKKYRLVERTGIQLKVLEEGTVGTTNLGEQDAKALRGVKRMYGKAIFPEAFSVLRTSTTIS